MQDFLILDFVINPNLDLYEVSVYSEKVPHISHRVQIFCIVRWRWLYDIIVDYLH